MELKRVSIEESNQYVKLSANDANQATAFVLIPGEDGWDEVIYLTKEYTKSKEHLQDIIKGSLKMAGYSYPYTSSR
jgi:hypothetical protein